MYIIQIAFVARDLHPTIFIIM